MTSRLAVTLAGVLFVLGACQPTVPADSARVAVVATTTVLADLVREVGGDEVEVRSLVPAGGEVHTFDPRPSDVTALADADLVVINGLGLDDWVQGLAAEAGSNAPLVALAEALDGVEYLAGGEHEHEEEEGHDSEEGLNPHLWLDAEYAELYVRRIADALASVDADGGQAYQAAAEAYAQELRELDRWVGEQMKTIPDERRRVVSVHAAFDYFARAYGLELVGAVIEAPGQDPSAGELAALIDEIRELGVSAILAESQFPTTLAERIADETGVTVVPGLHTDALDATVDSYLELMRDNTERIVQALADGRE